MKNRRQPYRHPRNQRLPEEYYNAIGRVCFITIRAYRGQSPFVTPVLNDAIIETLRAERERLQCWVHIYCLMPDHLQMIVSPRADGHSVLTFVDQFKGKTTNLSWKYGWRGKLWQPRSYDDVVRCEKALPDYASYILSDPARNNLVDCEEQYTWREVWDAFP
jgi:REP element-mobilizing transposase RayT